MATPIPGLPGDEVDFSVLKEDWSKYEVLGGQGIVWIRGVLLKLYRVTQAGAPPDTYAAATQTMVTAFFDRVLRGPPTPGPITPADFDREGELLTPVTLEEPTNAYLLPGAEPKVITTKMVATRIRVLRERRNPLGDPYVSADGQVVVGQTRPARVEELGR
jgi:hypothetical protein